MSFFGKLLAARGSDAYQEGVALLEQGRAAEAIPLLKSVFEQDPRSLKGSLAGLHLRQSIVTEARRLLQAGQGEPAADLLDGAMGHWPDFPDLQFLAGAAHAFVERWDRALAAARAALRRNPDYCEARLLEACSLGGLGRVREARASLLAMLESGRRVDHVLVHALQADLDRVPEDACPDLMGRLRTIALGDDLKRSVAEAVAMCRAGFWQEGLASLRQLGGMHPQYPDIRARLAAALYQAGDVAEALHEVEAALQLNPKYRTAASLKGLILAELGRLQEARDFLAETVPRLEGLAGRHEEMFLAYLRAALALLLGDIPACREHLEGWHDLPRQFARAALLLAACDDLSNLPDAALLRLEELCRIWSGDAEMSFLRVGLLVRQKKFAAAQAALEQWPGGSGGLSDGRPLLLRSRLDLEQARQPTLPGDPAENSTPIHEAAWRQLAIAAHLLCGESDPAWRLIRKQLDSGMADEETGRLCLRTATLGGQPLPADLAALVGPPDSWLQDYCTLLRRRHEGDQAEDLVRKRRAVRPDRAQWSWLSADFWLDPVRRWLG